MYGRSVSINPSSCKIAAQNLPKIKRFGTFCVRTMICIYGKIAAYAGTSRLFAAYAGACRCLWRLKKQNLTDNCPLKTDHSSSYNAPPANQASPLCPTNQHRLRHCCNKSATG